MDGLSVFVDAAVDVISEMNAYAAGLDGRVAFVLGLLTWFGIERAVRRLAGALRIAIIVGALGAAGVGTAAFFAGGDDRPPEAVSE